MCLSLDADVYQHTQPYKERQETKPVKWSMYKYKDYLYGEKLCKEPQISPIYKPLRKPYPK